LRVDGLHVAFDIHAGDATAAAVEIAHEVAGEIDGRFDANFHDGFEQGGFGELHGGAKSFAAGEFKGHFGGIDIVIGAVVDGGFEIGDGIAGEEALGGGFNDAFFNSGDEIARDCAAENFVGELELLAARQRLHSDPAIAELAVTAGLFFVAALHAGGAANGFAIGNFGCVQLDFDTVAALETADDDFDMLLAVAGEQEFVGLRIAIKAQGTVFFENFVDGGREAVFIVARFGGDGVGDGGLGNVDAFEGRGVGFFGEGVVGEGVFELGDDADIAGAQFGNGLHGFAERSGDVGEAFVDAGAQVVEVGVVFDDARLHFEKRDAAGEGVGGSFKDEGGGRAGIGGGRGQDLGDERENEIGADVVAGGGAEDGENAASSDGFLEAADDVFDGQRASGEELFHELVVAFGDHFDECFMGGIGGGFLRSGDIAFFAFAVAVGLVAEGFHADEIDDAGEGFFFAERELNGDGGAAETGVNAFERAFERGAFAIELVDDEEAGQLHVFGELPDFFGGDFDAGDTVEQDDGGIGGNHGGLRFGEEDVVARRIDDVELGFLPRKGGDGRRDGDFARHFLFVEIRGGVAFVHLEEPVGDTGREKHSGGKRRFPAMPVSNQSDIPYVSCVKDLHCENLQRFELAAAWLHEVESISKRD